MRGKLLIYGTSFVALILLNVFAALKVQAHYSRQQYITNLFEEIEHQKNNQDLFDSSSSPFATHTVEADIETTDGRVANLKSFLRKYNSPLYDHAEYIVMVSDKYKFDYRLLVAISMQESNACRVIPEGSHNCWGWGIYGDHVLKFDSYEEAIETVAAGIKKEYLDKGLVTASAIMAKYTPSSNGSWAYGVNHFLQALQ